MTTITSIDSVTLEAPDPEAAARFYAEAFALGPRVHTIAAEAPTSGFRGFTLSLITKQPADVRALVDAALEAGATLIKPAKKSLWGFGGVVRAPDGAVWNLASSSKRDHGPGGRQFESIVLLLGVDDVGASKQFYGDRGLVVGKSYGSYVDFAIADSPIGFGLYKRRALAKSAGVPEAGSGSHRLRIVNDGGSFTDPDGFVWETTAA